MRRAKGRREYIRFQKGIRLTRGQAILAKCYECMGKYGDGTIDCKMTNCPLYEYMPYRED